MTGYVTIPNTDVDAESPLDVDLMTALRDNPIAIAEQDATAPRQVGANLVELASATASGSSSLDFTSGIDSTYHAYLFTIEHLVPATNSTALRARFYISGAWQTTLYRTVYDWAASDASSGITNDTAGIIFTDTSTNLQGNNATNSLSGQMILYGPSNTSSHKKVIGQSTYGDSSNVLCTGSIGGTHPSTAAITGVRFIQSSGNLTSGIVRMYGIKDV